MEKPMDLEEMQSIQRELQKKYEAKWGDLSPQKGKDQLLWMLAEAGEMADVIKKQGSDSIMEDAQVRSHFVEEMCDVMMYWNDVALCFAITPEEIAAAYRSKHRKNMSRWSVKEESSSQ